MHRAAARASQIALDLGVLTAAYGLAFVARFEGVIPTTMVGRLVFSWPYVVLAQYLVLRIAGVHRLAWRYVSLRDAMRILGAVVAGFAGICLFRFLAGAAEPTYPFLRHGVLPYGVLVVDAVFAFLGLSGMRALRRLLGEHNEAARRDGTATAQSKAIMLVGAGQAGVMVARELAMRPELGLRAVGFLDDDRSKVGSLVHGIPVLGTTDELVRLCTKHGASEVLITMASAPGAAVRRITSLCKEADLPVKIIPGLYEVVDGRANLSRLRDVAIEDLLRREPVQLDIDGIRRFITGHVVLVTGAGGSIGSELCRQLCKFGPRALVLVERTENNLFHVHRELTGTHPDLEIHPRIADICDGARLEEVFRAHRPSVVFHAAAHKHVPMMEWNPGEAIKNNVLGTVQVADLALAFGAEAFVMISTDKAVNPTSVMGATKRVAEMHVQALAVHGKTRFVTVRFGNVLGSNGSVVPIFREQIERGGPVTVTHCDMTRYFMTIPEACQLVLQAASMGRGGEVFVLDMGEPVKIVDLARDLIRLSGLREGEDIDIVYTGLRPGEKLFEELLTAHEHADSTVHPKIFVGRTRRLEPAEVARRVQVLRDVLESPSRERVRSALKSVVPELIEEPPVVAPSQEVRRVEDGGALEPAGAAT